MGRTPRPGIHGNALDTPVGCPDDEPRLGDDANFLSGSDFFRRTAGCQQRRSVVTPAASDAWVRNPRRWVTCCGDHQRTFRPWACLAAMRWTRSPSRRSTTEDVAAAPAADRRRHRPCETKVGGVWLGPHGLDDLQRLARWRPVNRRNGCRRLATSRRNQPAPNPRSRRPWEMTSSVAAILASTKDEVGIAQHAGAQPQLRGVAAEAAHENEILQDSLCLVVTVGRYPPAKHPTR